MAETWCPFAIKRVGAQGLGAKNGYPEGVQGISKELAMASPKRGEVKHDSTGPLSATLGVLDNHPINSWHFTVDKELYQHYPLEANCWHGNDTDPDGEVRANIELVGVEHTRVDTAKLVPLTPRQVELTTNLTRWLQEQSGRPVAVRFAPFPQGDDTWELCEHNEVGNEPTACPSGRIPWRAILAGLDAEPAPPARVWLYGNEQAGLELRGNQQFFWNLGIEVDAIGDFEGKLPGSHWHHAGDNPDGTPNWVKVLD